MNSNALELTKTSINLEFIVPGDESNELSTISTKLSMISPSSLTVYKSIRSILHINNIIMDCTFNFDSNTMASSAALICDINTACITSSNSENEMLIHFENLGVGDLQISQIKIQNQILYNTNNNLLCIGDSKTCNNKRYIDFKASNNMNKLYPLISEMHPKTSICNPKNFIYNNNKNGRKLLVSHVYHDEVYGAEQYTGHNNTHGHAEYMDIILTIIFLILIVVSVFNMSYAFGYSFNFKPKYVDTRRV